MKYFTIQPSKSLRKRNQCKVFSIVQLILIRINWTNTTNEYPKMPLWTESVLVAWRLLLFRCSFLSKYIIFFILKNKKIESRKKTSWIFYHFKSNSQYFSFLICSSSSTFSQASCVHRWSLGEFESITFCSPAVRHLWLHHCSIEFNLVYLI